MINTPPDSMPAPPRLLNEAERKALIDTYADLMTEIKERTLNLPLILNGQTGLNTYLGKEFCYLQLRLICECIAFACAVAHGDLASVKSKKFQQNYAADKILTILEELHPDFYPRPISIDITPGKPMNLSDRGGDVLTKQGLKKLVTLCGQKVHKGYIKDYAPFPPEDPSENREILRWGQRIINLLDRHMIGRTGSLEWVICWWMTPEKNAVHVAFGAPSPEGGGAMSDGPTKS